MACKESGTPYMDVGKLGLTLEARGGCTSIGVLQRGSCTPGLTVVLYGGRPIMKLPA